MNRQISLFSQLIKNLCVFQAVSPLISKMLDTKNVYEIYKLAKSSYFPDLLQSTELFIKENIISINNDFFVELTTSQVRH